MKGRWMVALLAAICVLALQASHAGDDTDVGVLQRQVEAETVVLHGVQSTTTSDDTRVDAASISSLTDRTGFSNIVARLGKPNIIEPPSRVAAFRQAYWRLVYLHCLDERIAYVLRLSDEEGKPGRLVSAEVSLSTKSSLVPLGRLMLSAASQGADVAPKEEPSAGTPR